ncbi:H/ACA ribonucleoprotein complex non-core subunit NAF1 isoform X2 [Ricinus communis]|uniref:H/ACA ribonucleoprotein complex non-core subunit NAF1 isoform X2 n=1 Tax=Ricinus communis TaxID=3988 RepID=UPI0007729A78|nr:H/ACA ribonucleoprotein complex non-core subunit NAF1 isoform X2 [Ricinus communis]|eukprot:XP_015574017.1 H/ACA ribonucleoprotein complex non-core subunit NAF1 isoform X2 [Ricinus communis]
MVGFITEPTTTVKEEIEEEHNQASKFRNSKESIEPFHAKFSDLSFDDSSIDFDYIREFFQDSPDFDRVSLDKIDFGGFGKCIMDMGDKDCSFGTNPVVDCCNLSIDGSKAIEGQSGGSVMVKEEKVDFEREENLGSFIEEGIGKVSLVGGPDCGDGQGSVMVEEEKVEFEREGNLGSLIEKEIGKVSLVGGLSADCGDGIVEKSEVIGVEVEMRRESLVAASSSVFPDESFAMSGVAGDERDIGNPTLATGSSAVNGLGSGVNNEVMGDDDESGSDGKSASGSSSSSTSSSNNDDDEEEEEDESNEEEEEEGMQLKREVEEGEIEEGEIREINGEGMVHKSDEDEEEDEKNMVEWSDVEFDDIEEEEEGTGLMKGPIRSQNELKIINAQVIVEGVEKHNPLNEGSILWITEKRSPLGLVDEIFGPVQNPYYVVRYNSESEVPSGISQGTRISFVAEFANHVLNEKNLYKKGYDASGENDEELSDEAEFSDDEKEAEYMRMKKMSKRGINGQTVGNKKNSRTKDKNRNGNRKNVGPLGQHASMCGGQLPPPNQNQQNTSSAVASMNNYSSSSSFTGGASFFQPFPPMAQSAGLFQPSNGAWISGLASQQPQNAVIPGGFPANNMSWAAQNQFHPPSRMPITNGMPFQQQFIPSQGSLSNGVPPGGQMSFFAGPSPWPAVIGQNCFNQAPFEMGFQVQPTQPIMNVGDQGNGLGVSAVIPGNIQAPQQFNSGAPSGRGGRRQFHRGGGRFAGGRGGRGRKGT